MHTAEQRISGSSSMTQQCHFHSCQCQISLFLLVLGCCSVTHAQGANREHESHAKVAWKAVGKAVVGRLEEHSRGEFLARDDGPGAWYFASKDLLGCKHTPHAGAKYELEFQFEHLEHDTRSQDPMSGVPDVMMRCHPAPRRPTACSHRGDETKLSETSKATMTVGLFGVIDPWERSVYRVKLLSSSWVDMESKRNATLQDMQHIIHCAGETTLMLRGGHFAGAESVVIKNVRINTGTARHGRAMHADVDAHDQLHAAARTPVVTRTSLPSKPTMQFAPPQIDPHPLLHGRDEVLGRKWTEGKEDATTRVAAAARAAGKGRGEEQCFDVGRFDVFATGKTGVIAVAGESLLLATPAGVRSFTLLSQPTFPGAAPPAAQAAAAAAADITHAAQRKRLWRVVDDVLLIASDNPPPDTLGVCVCVCVRERECVCARAPQAVCAKSS